MGEFIQSIQMMKVYIILFALTYIFFDGIYSKGLGPDPFSRGKSCTSNSDCTASGVTCCGAGQAWGRCCPDGLCLDNCTYGDITFDYCGTYCPDYPKTTQSTPAYLSTTTTGTTTVTTSATTSACPTCPPCKRRTTPSNLYGDDTTVTTTTVTTTATTTVTTTATTTVTTTDPNATTTGSTTVTTTDPNATTTVTTTSAATTSACTCPTCSYY